MESTKKQRPQGRPRDSRIDDAVLRATVELLDEIGYARLTIPLVATRAGATPPAVYRRFPTKLELVYEAVFPTPPGAELPLTGGPCGQRQKRRPYAAQDAVDLLAGRSTAPNRSICPMHAVDPRGAPP